MPPIRHLCSACTVPVCLSRLSRLALAATRHHTCHGRCLHGSALPSVAFCTCVRGQTIPCLHACVVRGARARALSLQAPFSGWAFDETLTLNLSRPAAGDHGEHTFTRRALPFAVGERLRVTLVQADWRHVVYDDWRHLHAVLTEVRRRSVDTQRAVHSHACTACTARTARTAALLIQA
jgi:hypothetical protein